MPTVRQLLQEALTKLCLAGVETPILDAEVMMANALGCSRTDIMAHGEAEPSRESAQKFQQWTDRRSRREPLAYILGSREFYSNTFEVTPAVLIPRQETEFLVEAAIAALQDKPSPSAADIGLGSGCVAISIAKAVPDSIVYGTESSPDALAIARRNAEHLGVQDRSRFMEGDLFEPLAGLRFDIIVSNPPYIPSVDIDSLQPEVVEYEPHQALDGGRDGLDIVRRLVSDSTGYLNYEGTLAIEIGVGEAATVECMFRSNGFQDVRSIKDYSGIERVVIGVCR